MKRIKLGILQTNLDKSVDVGDVFPDDAHRFRDMFDLQDDRFQYRIHMTIGGGVPQDLDEQAYMITGSPLSVLDHHIFMDDLMDFIRRCDAAEQPDGCALLGATEKCTIASFAKGNHILTTQSHPEFSHAFLSCVLRASKGAHWDTCADERIRLASPSMHFRRTLTQDNELQGKTMKKGDKVLLWFVSGSRDETVFDDPHTCHLGRRANRHLAFGQGGIHVCLGMHLAKLKGRTALEELVKRVGVFMATAPPTWTRSNFICGV